MTDETIKQAEEHLQKADPILGKLIKSQKLLLREPRTDYFFSLCRSIIGQQVSVAAATTIFARFEAITAVNPKKVFKLTDQAVRKIGLSRQKASYLHDLAEHFIKNPKVYDHLDALPDDEVITDLVAVKGIGIWTAQMFLMFTLGRPDVFAPDDVGLQRAMTNLYDWEETPTKQLLNDTASVWRPHRTIACFHLWQSLNNQQD